MFEGMKGWLPGRRDSGEGDGDTATPVIRRVEVRAVATARQRRSLPSFRGLTSRPRITNQVQARFDRVRAQVRDAFAPTQPVTDARVFAGRVRLLKQLIEVIEHRMSHVVLFGERGIGKTSLLHILAKLAGESDYVVLRTTLGARSEFSTMFRTMLRGVPARYHASVSPTADRASDVATLADLLPAGDFDARELSEVLGGVTSTRILILLDEYDRIESETFRQLIAELIKNLSDAAASVHLVIAGVSSNLDELIGYIPSIRRNVIGMPVNRLTQDEVREIVEIGEEATGLRFAADIVDLIVELANGSPYLVRLIAYHASMNALDAERLDVLAEDVSRGVDQMVEETEGRLPVPVARRARALAEAAEPAALADFARLAGTANGWFAPPAPGEGKGIVMARLVERFEREGLIERGQAAQDGTLHLVDEGLPTYLWMFAARTSLTGKAA